MLVHVTSYRGPYILHMLHKNFTCWKQFKFFILSENLLLRESPFHIVTCLQLSDFTLFFVYTLKLLKAPLWHIFLLCFEKHMTCFRACGSRVVHQLLNKTMPNISAQSQRGAPRHLWKRGAPRRAPRSPPLISTPALDYVKKEELASFYETIELIKVLCNVIKYFSIIPSCYALHSVLG